MRHRCEHEIIYDMLLVLRDRPLPTPLYLLYGGAKVGSDIQEKYYTILEECDLAKMTEHRNNVFKASITERGIQFLIFYKAIEDLMRSGFRATQKKLPRSIAS